jgi:hypothetical protein
MFPLLQLFYLSVDADHRQHHRADIFQQSNIKKTSFKSEKQQYNTKKKTNRKRTA